MIRHIKKLNFNQWLALVLVLCVVLITISFLVNDGVVVKHKGFIGVSLDSLELGGSMDFSGTDLYLHHDGEIESNYDNISIDGATIYNR